MGLTKSGKKSLKLKLDLPKRRNSLLVLRKPAAQSTEGHMLRNRGGLQELQPAPADSYRGHRDLMPAPRGTELCRQACERLWRRKRQPPPAFFSGKSHRGKSLAGYCLWGRQRVRHNLATKQSQNILLSQTGESDFLFVSY